MNSSYFWYAVNTLYADMLKAKADLPPDVRNFLDGEHLASDWLFTTTNKILGFAIEKPIVDSFTTYIKLANRIDAGEAFDLFNIPNTQALYSFWLYRDVTWVNPNFCVDHMALLYVGMTSNLKQRLKQHHRMDEILFLLDCGFSVDFLYLSENDMMKFKYLQKTERDFIENFYPIMNGNVRSIGNDECLFDAGEQSQSFNIPCMIA